MPVPGTPAVFRRVWQGKSTATIPIVVDDDDLVVHRTMTGAPIRYMATPRAARLAALELGTCGSSTSVTDKVVGTVRPRPRQALLLPTRGRRSQAWLPAAPVPSGRVVDDRRIR